MKNFIFPHIFQPVLGQNNLSLLSQWHLTSRRIQTQVQLSSQKLKTHRNIKAHNGLNLKLSVSNHKKLDYKQINLKTNSFIPNSSQDHENQVKFDASSDKTVQQTNDIANKQNAFKQNTVRINTHRKIIKNGFKSTKYSQRKYKIIDNSKKYVKNLQKVDLKSKRNNQNKSAGGFSNQKFDKSNKTAQKVTFKTEQQQINQKDQKKDITIQHNQYLKSRQKSQNNSQKSKGIKLPSRDELKFSKKVISKQKRRNGFQKPQKIQIQVQMTQKMLQVIDRNKIYNQIKEKELHLKQNCQQAYSECNIFKSGPSIQKIQKKFNKKKSYKGLTYHILQGQREVRQHKRSYTIWDIDNDNSEQQYSIKNVQAESTKNQDKEKKKKKVHFGRTSIEQKTEAKNNVSISNIQSSKAVKFKGIPKRSSQIDPVESIPDIGDRKSYKYFAANKNDIKKAIRMKKMETSNVYNELNYFRLRLNLKKRQQEQCDIGKPHPQPIIYSVQKVMNELQNQRRQRTKLNNMMIDFGVNLTRDFNLKQKAIRDKFHKFST